MPDTWGVANDVPESMEKPPSPRGHATAVAAANILTPGAAVSFKERKEYN